MLYLLNSPILTSFGNFEFKLVDIQTAKDLVKYGCQSYIGHQSTCDILQVLLGIEVPLNRVQYFQQEGEQALIFKLLSRPTEGIVFETIEAIEEQGYEFGLLTKLLTKGINEG